MSENKIKRPVIKLALFGDSPGGKTCIFNILHGLSFGQTIPTIFYDKTDRLFKLETGKK